MHHPSPNTGLIIAVNLCTYLGCQQSLDWTTRSFDFNLEHSHYYVKMSSQSLTEVGKSFCGWDLVLVHRLSVYYMPVTLMHYDQIDMTKRVYRRARVGI